MNTTTTHDGRNFDLDLGIASGEAAQMRVREPERAYPMHAPVEEAHGDVDTYYDMPLLKEPVWIWTIPTYFFVGGASGAASVLAMAAPKELSRAAHLLGVAADTLSAVLLISDLGRPSRFLHMLRVFRPTSPMSIGSWVLALSGATSLGAFLLGDRPVGRAMGVSAGLLGAPLAGYTAVLLTNSANPVWSGARKSLPVLFIASGMASAGGLLSLLPLDRRSTRIARRYALFGRIGELAAGVAMERELARNPRAREKLHTGVAGALFGASRVATVASLLFSFGRRTQRLADVAGLAGALALRFAVFHAGKAGARDPRATT